MVGNPEDRFSHFEAHISGGGTLAALTHFWSLLHVHTLPLTKQN